MPVLIRAASARDDEALGRMGAALALQHHRFDPCRFMLPKDVEAGYRAWLSKERQSQLSSVLVAELDGVVVGYAYGRVEGPDWTLLLDAHGGFHDLWVSEASRRSGAGRALSEAMVKALTEKGAPRVVLSAASKNEGAQRLFASLGFRPTMVEMTRDP